MGWDGTSRQLKKWKDSILDGWRGEGDKMEQTREILRAMSPQQRQQWMQERKWIAEARREVEAEVDAEIQAEEDIKKRKKLCQVPHNTNWCHACGNRRIETVEAQNTGWYVQDKHNQLHKQR